MLFHYTRFYPPYNGNKIRGFQILLRVSKDTTSGMKKQRIMRWVSVKALPRFADMANLLVSGSSPNSVGTGRATCSPSNIGHSNSQDASSRHGTLSLDKIQQLVYVKYYIYVEKANPN